MDFAAESANSMNMTWIKSLKEQQNTSKYCNSRPCSPSFIHISVGASEIVVFLQGSKHQARLEAWTTWTSF
jgi:hypothetical protein